MDWAELVNLHGLNPAYLLIGVGFVVYAGKVVVRLIVKGPDGKTDVFKIHVPQDEVKKHKLDERN